MRRAGLLFALIVCAIAGPAVALPGNAPRPARRTTSLVKVAEPGFDASTRVLLPAAQSNPPIELFQAIASPAQGGYLLAWLQTPAHAQDHEYGVNDNFSLRVFALAGQDRNARVVAQSSPITIHWAESPHWAQRLSRLDRSAYRIGDGELAYGVRVQAEYRYKMQLSKRERLLLFRRQGQTLTLVLDTLVADCECCPEEAYPTSACECFEPDRSCPGYKPAAARVLDTATLGMRDIGKTFGNASCTFAWNGDRYELRGADPLPEHER